VARSTARRQVRNALAGIQACLPVPWDIEVLIDRLSNQRGRRIELVSWDFPPAADSPTGLWIPTGKADYIFHDAAASPGRREQIIGHELGHLLLGHTPRLSDVPDGLLAALTPALHPELARRLLAAARTGYAGAEEAAAELFGTSLIRAGASTRRPVAGGELGRLTEALR
jgi:hypothetical protein